MRRSNPAGLILVVLLLLASGSYLVYSQNQIGSLKRQLAGEQKEQQQLDAGAAINVNREFITQFFTYASTKSRYEQIQPLMTAKGYKATAPSGMDFPATPVSSIMSRINGLLVYTLQQPDEKATAFINEFEVVTNVNGAESKKIMRIKTTLVRTEEAWLIDDIEVISA